MDEGRIKDCDKLLANTKGGLASPLNEEEVLYLCQQIAAAGPEPPPHWALVLVWWQLAYTVSASPQIRELAQRTLDNPKARRRGMAFKYLQHDYPDEAATLFGKLEKDQDAELLYALAVSIRDRDPIKAIHLCIDAFLLPLRIHDLPESLAMEIEALGTWEHAARLRGLVKDWGAGPESLTWLAEKIENRQISQAVQKMWSCITSGKRGDSG